MLGEKYIEIDLGNIAAPLLPPGGKIIKTDSAVEFDQLLAKVPALLDDFRPILDDVKAVTGTLQKVIGSQEGENNLKTNDRQFYRDQQNPEPGGEKFVRGAGHPRASF